MDVNDNEYYPPDSPYNSLGKLQNSDLSGEQVELKFDLHDSVIQVSFALKISLCFRESEDIELPNGELSIPPMLF